MRGAPAVRGDGHVCCRGTEGMLDPPPPRLLLGCCSSTTLGTPRRSPAGRCMHAHAARSRLPACDPACRRSSARRLCVHGAGSMHARPLPPTKWW